MNESHDLAEEFAATGIPLAFLEGDDLAEFAARHRTGRFAVLVLDAGSVRLLEQVGVSRSQQLHELRDRVVLDLMQQMPLPLEAPLTQAQLEVEAREQVLREFGSLSSTEVSRLGGTGAASNPYARAHRWRQSRRVFAVDVQGKAEYPAFQFDLETGEPRSGMREVLEETGKVLNDWQTAIWFTTPNGWLRDRRPVDVLEDDPNAVAEAASHLSHESGY